MMFPVADWVPVTLKVPVWVSIWAALQRVVELPRILYFRLAFDQEMLDPESTLGEAMARPTCEALRETLTVVDVAKAPFVVTTGIMLAGLTSCQMLKPGLRYWEPVPFHVRASVPEVSVLFSMYQQSVTWPA
jgi:hypothetical protein